MAVSAKRICAGLAAAVLAVATICAQQQDPLLKQASSAFTTAQQADKALNAKPQAEQTRSEVLKVINAYQRVYLITPKTSYADDALLAISHLYLSINDTADAIKTLKFLV